ncbi:MAG TPA: zf-HC2 domain-containing protein [Solirubrobacterales bacterium]|jgi:anti-sigma factor RsiW|nr:zf-HC2 domain-containing protein [Solirubrobacterales bacterium]
MACQELVELVTEYLEGRLSPVDRERFDAHIAGCDACTAYLEQMRMTLDALGRIPEESIPVEAREELLIAFREWRA